MCFGQFAVTVVVIALQLVLVCGTLEVICHRVYGAARNVGVENVDERNKDGEDI